MNRYRSTAAALALLAAVGCSHGPEPMSLQSSNVVTVEGDKPAVFTVPADGQFAVVDENSQTTLFVSRVTKGQTVTVDPTQKKIFVGDATAESKPVVPGNRLHLIFNPT